MSGASSYVYALFDSGTPFYIGKGAGNRYLSHLQIARAGSHLPVHRKIRKLGYKIDSRILCDGLTESDAYELEELSIRTIGRRRDGGPLLNVSLGGKGGMLGVAVKLTREQLDRHLAAMQSKDVREKISIGVRAADRVLTDAGRAAISRTHKGKTVTKETRLKISQARSGIGHPHTKESRAKIAVANSRRVVSDSTRKKISESVKANPLTEDQRERQRAAVLKQVTCPVCGKVGARSIMMRWHFDNCRGNRHGH